MCAWRRYPKIESSSASWGAGPSDAQQWVVTEKLHGANFSVVAAGDGSIAFASRSGILAEHDNFFGFKSAGLCSRLTVQVVELRRALVEASVASADATVVLFGELCGGKYPSPAVPPVPGAAPVQNGVWYSPSLQFVAFDVMICSGSAAPSAHFLDFNAARDAARAAGFRFADPLMVGPLAACLDFDIRFTSRLPAALALPPLETTPNLAEGVVIRPLREPDAGSGSGRRLLKRKIAEFSERQYRNDEWRQTRFGGCGGDGGSGDTEAIARFELLAALNANRLDAVVSKRGHVDTTDRAACRRLLDELLEDAWDDALAALEEAHGVEAPPQAAAPAQARPQGDAHAPATSDAVEEEVLRAPQAQLVARSTLRERYPCLHAEAERATRVLVTAYLRTQQPR